MVGLALLTKVAQLEERRPGLDQEERRAWEEQVAQARLLTAELDHLREEDVRAYAAMTGTREAGETIQEAVAYALEVPRRIMGRCREALDLAAWAGARCRRHLVSDLQVARELLRAGLQGAGQIARANLPWVAVASRREVFSRQLSQEAQDGERAYLAAGEVLAAR
jgi:formiminotetrahydrofolate cyclodeaminase